MDLDTPIDRGFPFELGDLWRKSDLSDEIDTPNNRFVTLDVVHAASDLRAEIEQVSHFAFQDVLDDVALARDALAEAHLSQPSEPENHSLKAAHTGDESASDAFDIDLALQSEANAKSCSWDGFSRDENGDFQPLYLSEAGPSAFDAAYSVANRAGEDVGVLPQSYALWHLRNLVLGRSSALFAWSETRELFEQTLTKVSVSGLSLPCWESLVAELSETGAVFRKINIQAQKAGSFHQTSAALQALRACVLQIATSVEEEISNNVARARSILHLQNLIRRPRRLMNTMLSMLSAVKDCYTDESLISALSDFIYDRTEALKHFCPLLRAVLARVSVPWLEKVAAEIGFGSPSIAVMGDRFISEDSTVDSAKFIASDDAALIYEIKTALRAIYESAADHQIINARSTNSHAAFVAMTGSVVNATQIKKVSLEYEKMMTNTIFHGRSPQDIVAPQQANTSSCLHSTVADAWGDETSQQIYIADLDSTMSHKLGNDEEKNSSDLQQNVISCLQAEAEECMEDVSNVEPGLYLTPVERIRPLLEAQSRVVNGIALRQIFRNRKLLQHLEMHRSLRLLGDGEFVSKLSTALFSPELQSATRKRGVAPTGQNIGLRLGSHDSHSWPPASSELCLVLMDVMQEVHESKRRHAPWSVRGKTELEEGLNFAVRELPEQDIERVMDVNSIHALDFLGLQYTAPAPLNRVLTPETSRDYDSIFRLLLLCMRLLYLMTHMREPCGSRRDQARAETKSFTCANAFLNAAHHFVSVVFSHFMDIGIDTPWRSFTSVIKRIEANLDREDADGKLDSQVTVSISSLRELHLSCIDRIKNRLFLKRKQQKLRTALEEVFSRILHCATSFSKVEMSDSPDLLTAYSSFRHSSQRFCEALQEVVEKVPKVIGADKLEDTDSSKILLGRLRFNDFI